MKFWENHTLPRVNTTWHGMWIGVWWCISSFSFLFFPIRSRNANKTIKSIIVEVPDLDSDIFSFQKPPFGSIKGGSVKAPVYTDTYTDTQIVLSKGERIFWVSCQWHKHFRYILKLKIHAVWFIRNTYKKHSLEFWKFKKRLLVCQEGLRNSGTHFA